MTLLFNSLRKIHHGIQNRKRNDMINKVIDITRYETIRCGNEYGGFEVLEKNLHGEKIIVYSFGIGEDLSFSEDILKHFGGAEIYAFDPTSKAAEYVKNSDVYSKKEFHFYDYALADGDGEDVFSSRKMKVMFPVHYVRSIKI